MTDLQFEDDIGRVTRDGVKVMIAATPYRYLRVLAAARGKMLPAARIIAEVYGPDRAPSRHLVPVTIRKLRKRIARLGLEIVSCKGVGYGLAEVKR